MPERDTPKAMPSPDPWQVVGYLTSGVLFYGFLGWAADRWLGTSWLVAVGIIFGAGLGIYMTWARFSKPFTDTHPGHDTGELE